MKVLHLIRHAKSSWDNPDWADIKRPLNPRGLESCQIMAPEIARYCDFPEVFCSPAVRAQSTLQGFKEVLPELSDWTTDEALYTFSSWDLLEWCRQLDESLEQVTVVGHNPALTDLCNEVGDQPIDNIPTCGYVKLQTVCSQWRELSAGSAKVAAFLYPKKFR
ncbi:SixA phosphatase family protein [Pseudomaricurvus sp.]|uniref:SixA phosphatase family protein n=1 Tax=Pseudomaricurvus sp. TaxID=2004510 RepID=UPI003F6B7595